MKLQRTRQSCALFSPPQYPAEVQAKLETGADCKYYSRNHLQALLHQAGMSRLVGPNMRKLWRLEIETKDLSVFQVQGLTGFTSRIKGLGNQRYMVVTLWPTQRAPKLGQLYASCQTQHDSQKKCSQMSTTASNQNRVLRPNIKDLESYFMHNCAQ